MTAEPAGSFHARRPSVAADVFTATHDDKIVLFFCFPELSGAFLKVFSLLRPFLRSVRRDPDFRQDKRTQRLRLYRQVYAGDVGAREHTHKPQHSTHADMSTRASSLLQAEGPVHLPSVFYSGCQNGEEEREPDTLGPPPLPSL